MSRRRGAGAIAERAPAVDATAVATPVTPPPFAPLRRDGPAYAAIVLVWAALFAPQLFMGKVFTLGDARNFRPFPEYSRERWLTHHQRTHWNPFVFGGISATASLADPRPQYLPDLALDAFEQLRPSNVVPQGGPLFAHLAGMLAMAALARALWRSGAAGMALAGLGLGLGPELLVPFAFGHDAQFVSFSLLPVILLAIHHVCASDARGAFGASLVLALAAGMLALNGHPQVEVLGGLLALGLAIERAFHFRRPERLVWLAGAGALALAIGAAVWLPAMRYSEDSFRGGGGSLGVSLTEVARFSFGARDLLSLAWPQAVGFGGATYWGGLLGTDYPRFLGVVMLLLACGAVARGRRERVVWLLAGFAAFAVVSSLGTSLGRAGEWLRAIVPMGSRFRVPTVWIGIAQLAVALLAARALAGRDAEAPAPPAEAPPERAPRVAWIVAAALLVLGLALAGPLREAFAGMIRSLRPAFDAATAATAARAAGLDLALRAAILAAAVTLLWRARTPRAGAATGADTPSRPIPLAAPVLAAAGLVALVVLDLGSVSYPVLARATGPLSSVMAAPEPELAKIGAREPWVRVSSTRDVAFVPGAPVVNRRDYEFYSNDWIRWRARTLGGTHGAPPALWRRMGDITRSYGAMCALGVVYMSADPGPAWGERDYEPFFRGPRESVYRLRGALGRAYAVPEVVAPGNDIVVIAAMMEPDFNPSQTAFASGPGVEGEYPGALQCHITWLADQPDTLVFETDAQDRAFLVIADAWFPGWRARLDGAEIPIHRVNQLLRGVIVERGHHQVEMTFEPRGWAAGVRLTRLGLLVMLALGIAWGVWTWRERASGGAMATAQARS
jgi:hypothetical protein